LRVLLCYKCSEDGRSDFFERILPVGLCSLQATLVRAGHDSSLANFSSRGWRAVAARLRETRPEVVGISTFTFNRHASLSLARLAKKVLPSCTVILGGPHASHLHRQLLLENEALDFIVLGEGEETLPRLLECLASAGDPREVRGLAFRHDGEPGSNGWPEPIADLDRLPHPFEGFRGSGVDARTQFAYLITSRGCPARCTFCNTPGFWGSRIRFRSVEHVLAEMRRVREEYGLLYLSIRDDTFTANRRRVLELCERMREEKLYFLWDCQSRVNAVDDERLVALRRAGCVHIQYGVESGAARVLRSLNKDISLRQIEDAARATRAAGLVFSMYLITGVEGEEEAELRETEEMIRRTRPHDAVVSPLAVFPGTALWEEWKARHGLNDAAWSAMEREDVYVRAGQRASEKALQRIGRAVESQAARSAYTLEDYRVQRARIGDCHALDLAEADLHLLQGRPASAKQILERLRAREPENPWGAYRLGALLLEQGAAREAEEHLADLVRRVPRFVEGQVLHGHALVRLRRTARARRAFSRALSLDPSNAPARRAFRRLGVVEASAPAGFRARGRAALLRSG